MLPLSRSRAPLRTELTAPNAPDRKLEIQSSQASPEPPRPQSTLLWCIYPQGARRCPAVRPEIVSVRTSWIGLCETKSRQVRGLELGSASVTSVNFSRDARRDSNLAPSSGKLYLI